MESWKALVGSESLTQALYARLLWLGGVQKQKFPYSFGYEQVIGHYRFVDSGSTEAFVEFASEDVEGATVVITELEDAGLVEWVRPEHTLWVFSTPQQK